MALQTQQFAVNTSAVKLLTAMGGPTQVLLHNATKSSNEYIWFGGSSAVTTSTGIHLDPGEDYQFVLQPGNELWAISDDAQELHMMWQTL